MTTTPENSTEPNHCLYFLVCAANEGPLAGLLKVGIADCFPFRYAEHTRTWGAFDLTRSALLRARTREEVQHLEISLRRVFGHPSAEAAARAEGKILRSEDYSAMNSQRRHPGRCDDGHTEFFAEESREPMLAFTETWLAHRGERAAGARLQRGIDPADCEWPGEGDAGSPLTPAGRAARRAQRRARREQEQAALMEHIASRVNQVLDFALANEDHLLHVNLNLWRRVRATGGHWMSSSQGLVDLFFGGFGSPGNGTNADPEFPSAAQLAFEQRVEELCAAPVESELLRGRHWEQRTRVASLRVPFSRFEETVLDDDAISAVSRPDTVLVRVQPWYYDPVLPLFDRFEALAHRVEGRRGYEQPDLGL